MEESILDSVKKYIGFDESYEHFDQDLMMLINSGFSILTQLGAGPSEGFSISNSSTDWNEFSDSDLVCGLVREFIFLNTKVIFDPPQNSSVLESYKQRLDELKWRINVAVDTNVDNSNT